MFVRRRTYEALQEEHARLSRALEQARTYLAHYKARERDVSEAIVAAQAEGRRLRAEAEAEARAILTRARDEAAALKAAAHAQIASAERDLARLREAQRNAAGVAVPPAQDRVETRAHQGAPAFQLPRREPPGAGTSSVRARASTGIHSLAEGAPGFDSYLASEAPLEIPSLAANAMVAPRRGGQVLAVAAVVVLVLGAGAATVWWSTRAQPRAASATAAGEPVAASPPAPEAQPTPAATSGSEQPSPRPLQGEAPRRRAGAAPSSAQGRPPAVPVTRTPALARETAAPAAGPPKPGTVLQSPGLGGSSAPVSMAPPLERSHPPAAPAPTPTPETSVPMPPVAQVEPSPPAAAATVNSAAPLSAAATPPREASVRTPEEDVLSRHREYFTALGSGDVAALRQFTADGFSASAPFLEGSRGPRPLRVERETVEVRGVGAIVSGVAVEAPAAGADAPGSAASWLFSEVWINRDGRWLLLNVRFARPPRR